MSDVLPEAPVPSSDESPQAPPGATASAEAPSSAPAPAAAAAERGRSPSGAEAAAGAADVPAPPPPDDDDFFDLADAGLPAPDVACRTRCPAWGSATAGAWARGSRGDG